MRLTINIDSVFAREDQTQLNFRVVTATEGYSWTQYISNDLFKSEWERVWSHAKAELKNIILKEDLKNIILKEESNGN